jgi:hypothetical protein
VLGPYVAEAALSVMPPAPRKASLSVESVRVCKLQGGTIKDSLVMKGMVLSRSGQRRHRHPRAPACRSALTCAVLLSICACLRDTEGTIKRAEDAKVSERRCTRERSLGVLATTHLV